MGASCFKSSKSEDDIHQAATSKGERKSSYLYRRPFSLKRKAKPAEGQFMPTIAMLAQATHNAGNIANALSHMAQSGPSVADPSTVRDMIRKAKACDKTVSVQNQCLFIDYEFVCYVPPGMDF